MAGGKTQGQSGSGGHFKTALRIILRSFVKKRFARVFFEAKNLELFERVSASFLRRRRISAMRLALLATSSRPAGTKGANQ
jgi:hypothetical protein